MAEWAAICAILMAVSAQKPVVYYVSPQGNDSWSGRLAEPNKARSDGPFATIQRAQQAVREAKRNGVKASKWVISIRGGVYYLEQPLVLTPEDSGSAQAPVIYEAYNGEQVVISGGRPTLATHEELPEIPFACSDVRQMSQPQLPRAFYPAG